MSEKYNLSEIIDKCSALDCECHINESMKLHTSFKIGGNALIYISVKNIDSLANIIKVLKNNSIPYIVLGSGSNVLICDEGIDGAVIHLDGDFKKIKRKDNILCCGAGVPLISLCQFAQSEGLSGIEFAYGIPGTAGGAAYMNAGAYGGEMKDIVISCTHMDEDGNIVVLNQDELEFSYRHSAYTGSKNIILRVDLGLKNGSKEEISSLMEDYMNRRRAKQPLEYPSAGSVFKRPEGYYAGTLIEECGLKGTSVGGAMVSEKHAGFIINTGNATCSDVCALIDKIKKTVKEKKGVDLECEVRMIN
jgi:UDP-N-acetylmuramate dehydrogenase